MSIIPDREFNSLDVTEKDRMREVYGALLADPKASSADLTVLADYLGFGTRQWIIDRRHAQLYVSTLRELQATNPEKIAAALDRATAKVSAAEQRKAAALASLTREIEAAQAERAVAKAAVERRRALEVKAAEFATNKVLRAAGETVKPQGIASRVLSAVVNSISTPTEQTEPAPAAQTL